MADPDAILKDGHPLVAISGPNFSGRTQYLQGFCNRQHLKHIYVGPDVYNALSGLTSTVRQELELHSGESLSSLGIVGALSELGLQHILEQHPGTASGGEQACLAVLCGLALSPSALAIDCSLEQLDPIRLSKILKLLSEHRLPQGTLVADNRLHDWPIPVPTIPIEAVRQEPPPRSLVAPVEPGALADIIRAPAPSIVVENLDAGYRGRPKVLHQLNLSLAPGVYCLSGPIGSGKSTLAKVASGILRPSAGRILVNGQPAKLWRHPGQLVVYALQNPDVSLFESTVLDELRAGSGKDFAAERRVSALVSAFGLKEILSINPLSLPFPIRKRVSLAAALACPASWYFLDEPTLGADAATAGRLAELIRTLTAVGHGVVVVSHSTSFHRDLNGIPLHMHDGCIREGAG